MRIWGRAWFGGRLLALLVLAAVLAIGAYTHGEAETAIPREARDTSNGGPAAIGTGPFGPRELQFLPLSAQQVNLRPDDSSSRKPYFDLVLDEPRGRLYASNFDGNTVDVISLATLQVIASITAGAGPAGMDLSPEGAELAVALYRTGQVVFVNPDTLQITARVGPNSGPKSGPSMPYDVIYGRPGRLYSVGSPGSSGFDYVHVFDTASKREVGRSSTVIRDTPRLAISPDKQYLYVAEPSQLYGFSVTTDQPAQKQDIIFDPRVGRTLIAFPDGSEVVTSGGQVWESDLSNARGLFPVDGSEVEYAPSRGRVYISNLFLQRDPSGPASRVVEVDPTTYLVTRTRSFSPSTVGVMRASLDGKKLYVSTSTGIQVWDLEAGPSESPTSSNYQSPPLPIVDDFSDPRTGWSIGQDSVGTWTYLNGRYQLEAPQPNYILYADNKALYSADFTVAVDVSSDTPTRGSYGLYFCYNEDVGRYVFDVNPGAGSFKVYRRDFPGDATTTLVESPWSGAIHQGITTNHLQVTKRGPSITLFANGQQIAQVLDNTYGEGYVGLEATSVGANDEAFFDDFEMTFSALGVIPYVVSIPIHSS